jgi:hypothetical protein
MKNCDPIVSGPEFAIETTPRALCYRSKHEGTENKIIERKQMKDDSRTLIDSFVQETRSLKENRRWAVRLLISLT